MTATEVLPAGTKTLTELAEVANAEHQATGAALVDALGHAMNCGNALLAARDKVGPKEWDSWMTDNLRFGRGGATIYMRFAYYRHMIPAALTEPYVDSRGGLRQPTFTRAAAYVKGLPPMFDDVFRLRLPQSTRDEAKRLHKEGLNYTQIGNLLGISKNSALLICDPKARARYRANAQERRRQITAGRRALREKERREALDATVKNAGGALADAYSLIRRAAQRIDQASAEINDSESRHDLRQALTSVFQAEDAIAKSLKVVLPRRSHRPY
jgi:hypothetical protein